MPAGEGGGRFLGQTAVTCCSVSNYMCTKSPQTTPNPTEHTYSKYFKLTTMGGGWFPKLVWPKHNMINQQAKVGVANNNKRAKCWCGTGKVGVATATPAIRHSPPMLTTYAIPRVQPINLPQGGMLLKFYQHTASFASTVKLIFLL